MCSFTTNYYASQCFHNKTAINQAKWVKHSGYIFISMINILSEFQFIKSLSKILITTHQILL